MNRNGWPMARVVEKMPGKDGRIRSVKLRIGSKNNSDQTLIRPITKLDFLVRNEDAEKHRTKFGCQKETRCFEESQMKVAKQLTLLSH